MSGIRDYTSYSQMKENYKGLLTMQKSAAEDPGDRFGLVTIFNNEVRNHVYLLQNYGVAVSSSDEVIPAYKKILEDYERNNADEIRRIEQRNKWAAQGLCRECGGQLGLFKKCKSCGTKN